MQPLNAVQLLAEGKPGFLPPLASLPPYAPVSRRDLK